MRRPGNIPCMPVLGTDFKGEIWSEEKKEPLKGTFLFEGGSLEDISISFGGLKIIIFERLYSPKKINL